MLSRTNIVLTGLLVSVIGVTFVMRVDYSKPNLEILPDMKYSPAYSAFLPNTHFANGRTLQAPVAGTIARGQLPLHYAATKEDAIRAGEELRNPYSPETDRSDAGPGKSTAESLQASVARGNDVFRIYCVVCHGATGTGGGSVSQRGFPPPPSLLTGNSRQMKDGQLFHIVSYGQGNMPSLRPQLSVTRRWDVVNYIRSLQSQAGSGPAQSEVQAVHNPAAKGVIRFSGVDKTKRAFLWQVPL